MARVEGRSNADVGAGDGEIGGRHASYDRIKIREVAGVFRSNTVEDAIESLLLAGIDRADIDVRDDIEAIERNPGRIFSYAEDLPDRPRVPRRAFVDRIDSAVILSIVAGVCAFFSGAAAAWRVIASGGGVWAAAGAAILCGVTVSGIATWLTYRWLKTRFEQELSRQIAAMGIVVWVRVRSPEKEEMVPRILRGYGAEAIHVHEFEIDRAFEGMPLRLIRP